MKNNKDAHNNGCMICGEELVYQANSNLLICNICGNEFESNISCPSGHFVCNKCHGDNSRLAVHNICLDTDSINPFEIIKSVMDCDGVNMHGPEHHYIVACALLSAFCNAADSREKLEEFLSEAIKRGEQVPGGTCGFWGACGASISAGIFISIIAGVTPLSKEEYGLPSLMTADISKEIASIGGPRCCKRNSYLAIISAMERTRELTGIEMETDEDIMCHYSHMNNECTGNRCPFFSG